MRYWSIRISFLDMISIYMIAYCGFLVLFLGWVGLALRYIYLVLYIGNLEKAHAKLHGSFEALEGRLVQDALVDLIVVLARKLTWEVPKLRLILQVVDHYLWHKMGGMWMFMHLCVILV
jgi:hypothetical protein